MDSYLWYQVLIKPSWSPPSWVFGPVWAALYGIIAVSFGHVFYLFFKRKISFRLMLPFLLNLVFNFLFTPIQFGLRNNILAALDILLVLGTLIWGLILIFPKIKWIVLVNIPYLTWVLFATILQLTITILNW